MQMHRFSGFIRFAAVVLVALSAAAAPVTAQTGTVSGTVVNAATGAPIEGAVVRIQGTLFGSLSRPSGAFAILGVPPGVYTVSVRQLGFATSEIASVSVGIGRTRTLAFRLNVANADTTMRANAALPPVEPGVVSTGVSFNDFQLSSAPALTMSGVLASGGAEYYELPRNRGNTSVADERRGATSQASVRGGRVGATQHLIDGIAVNNPVFGSPPLLIEPMAAATVDFSPGYADAQHGAALSGLVNQVIREGSDRFAGALEYQTSALAGLLGSGASSERGAHFARGYISGPVPIAGNRFRFSLAAHVRTERHSVLRTEIPQPDTGSFFLAPRRYSEWRGFGGDDASQVLGKLTYSVRPTLKLSVATVAQSRNILGFDPRFLTGFGRTDRARTLIDSLAAVTGQVRSTVVPGSLRNNSTFIAGRIEKRFDRAHVALTLANNGARRETCNVWQGVCLLDRFAQIDEGSREIIQDETATFAPPPPDVPYDATGLYFGGESFTTRSARADFVLQATDHHQVQVGMYAAQHDLAYRQTVGLEQLLDGIRTATSVYRSRPREFASYVQDAMEFDGMTLRFGIRYDYGRTGGLAFTNPVDATNGTTAREVCEGRAPGIRETPFTYQGTSGMLACALSPLDASGRSVLLDSAMRLAQMDDFRVVEPRAAMSPRVGFSMPLTDRSAMFVNVGRYSKYPAYHDAFRNTGAGSRAGFGDGADDMCNLRRAKPDSDECAPTILFDPDQPEYVGNPNLAIEQANTIEAGFTSRIGDDKTFSTSVFSTEHSHLSSVYLSTDYNDIGLTYASRPRVPYRTVVSQGFIGALGVSATLRRNLSGTVAYSISYLWLRSTEIGPPPDVFSEALTAGEVPGSNLPIERVSSRNQTHSLNALFMLNYGAQPPKVFGAVGASVLRTSQFAVSLTTGSGLPASTANQGACLGNSSCALAIGQPSGETGHIVNVLYRRALAGGGRYAVTVRVLNLLDASDGSISVRNFQRRGAPGPVAPQLSDRESLRRILTGFHASF